ncbi:pyruvate dehydrogenase (acetyl-transferring) kinase, mitochondrial [Tanacetum coccineum]
MIEPTMEEYMTKIQEDYSGSKNKECNSEHIERVLEIVDLFTTSDVTQDQLMLCVFPITLTGAASRWLRNEPAGSITTWEILKGNFLSKYCPPSRTAKKMEEINNFHMQEVILYYKGLDVPTRKILDSKGMIHSDGLAAIQAQLNNIGREIKKVNERVYVAQVGRYRAVALEFYQRDNRNTLYQERRQTMEESLNKFMAKSAKRHDEHSSLIKEILASMNATIRFQGASIKALEIQIGQMRKMSCIELSRVSVPFPGRLKEKFCDENEVLMKLKKLQVNSTESAKSLRRLLKEKSRIEKKIKNVYVLGLRERMELDLEARVMGEAVILNRSQEPEFRDFLELNDLNQPLKLRNHKNEDLDLEIKEGEVIDEQMVDVLKIRHHDEIVEKIDEYPKNYDAYRDKETGDIIFGIHLCRVACVEARPNFTDLLPIHGDNDSVTYQMARSHPSTAVGLDDGETTSSSTIKLITTCSCLIDKYKYMMKVQVHVTKVFRNSDTQDLP